MSSSSNPPPNAGLQLFPPPPAKKKPGRKPSIRRNAINPQSPPTSAVERASSPEIPLEGRQSAMDGRQSAMDGRQSALDGRQSAMDGRQSAMNGRQSAMDGRQSAMTGRFSPASSTAPLINRMGNLPRADTSFSDAPTLVRSQSTRSHSSIAKPPLTDGTGSSGEPMIRSIFPRYNPNVPLEQQPYYPTQASPTHIPKTIISKAPYSPSIAERSMTSPLSAPPTIGSFPKGIQDVPVTRNPSSTEELKALWKVTNGWKVQQSEGRSFCLKMESDIDAPVHTLSSATQPFYTVRLDPTSTSALLTMTRQDPNKPAPKGSGSKGKEASGNEVLTTTLEETARRLPPNDGLVALLCPRAATEMALDMAMKPERPDADAVMAAAEREYARLVWDEDSRLYYLVHPAMSTPFVLQIKPLPAWSRVEYVFEHPELPRNLVKLVRDGSGGGFVEIDTGVAARIDSFYLVDVAICAILIVAFAEEKVKNVERFEAPPTAPSNPMSPKAKKPVKIDEMEVDLESQNSLKIEKKDKSSLPSSTKGALKVLFMTFKCMFWILTAIVKCLASCIICCSGCLTKKP